jgi:hypothetical protein
MTEYPLPGGFINGPVRVGDTVRRPLGARGEFVHRLLDRFERMGWSGAPRVLGVDERQREMLTFVEGQVPWQSPRSPDVDSVASLVAVARLVREFHDLTAGTDLAGEHEVVCHNDLSPKNTVYREQPDGLRPVAFIDWDLAAPGARVHDLALVCWQFLDLGPTVPDAAVAGGRMRAIADAYGFADRPVLLDTVVWWQDRCWRGIEAGASAGDAALVRLRDQGVVREVRAAREWVERHRHELDAAMS